MEFLYENIKVNYELELNGENLFVFLHGWGSNLNLMKPLSEIFTLESKLLIDFPPFGKSSQEPKVAWNLDNYCELTKQIIDISIKKAQEEGLLIKRIVLFGHSFGGRVAIKLAKFSNKLILISAAGLKPKFSLKTKTKILLYKFYKKIGSKKANLFGSQDYKVLSPVMKQTFNNIIGEDLKNVCKTIKTKTLIIFGTKDKETPPYMAKKLNQYIKNSKLVFISGADHFAYLKKAKETNLEIFNFVYEDEWKCF